MSTDGSIPPMFTDSDKFDGNSCKAWSNKIQIVAEIKGVVGYLDGTIPKPGPSPPTSLPIGTSWNSPSPSHNEWITRNAWAKALLVFNIKPIGLGVDTSGTAAEIWKSVKDSYEVTSCMARLYAEQELWDLTYLDGDDFQSYISSMRTRLAYARESGANITDKNFKAIILCSLPRTWDAAVSPLLHEDIPLSEAIF